MRIFPTESTSRKPSVLGNDDGNPDCLLHSQKSPYSNFGYLASRRRHRISRYNHIENSRVRNPGYDWIVWREHLDHLLPQGSFDVLISTHPVTRILHIPRSLPPQLNAPQHPSTSHQPSHLSPLNEATQQPAHKTPPAPSHPPTAQPQRHTPSPQPSNPHFNPPHSSACCPHRAHHP